MTQITVDMTRYWELIDQEKKLGHDLFNTNRENFSELLRYQVVLENEVYFRQREDYLSLLKAYLDDKLDEDFYFSFLTLWNRDRKQVDVLEQDFLQKGEPILETDSRANKFCHLLNCIFGAGEALTETEHTPIDQKNFRNEIRQYFLEMQELLKED